MDCLGQREALLDSKRLDSAIAAAQIDQRAASTGQTSLFDMFGGPVEVVPALAPALPASEVADIPASRERSLWEKEVLGFQFGDHPFLEASAWLAGQLSHDTSQITAEISGEKVRIAGLVTNVRRIVTRSKSQMAVAVLEDLHGSIEAVIFPRVYERLAEVLREDGILVVEGKVDTRSDRPQLVVDRAEVWTRPAGDPPVRPAPIAVKTAAGTAESHTKIAGDGTSGGNATNGRNATSGRSASNGGNASSGGNATNGRNGVNEGNGTNRSDGTDGINGTDGANGSNGTNGSHHAEKRILRVIVPREDDNACIRVLTQLQLLVQRSPGDDALQLVLHDRAGGRVELTGADIAVQDTPDLEAQVRNLVGDANLKVSTG
jgi:hypothetical protein